ncbi:MAG: sugar diacid recognition domain-containing protein [Carnobacterium sp.]|uniref:CdaR family transcriptional regulator n=1 Tax=Carnobacterium sp. TaxID=48221 RepID=UPI00331639DB
MLTSSQASLIVSKLMGDIPYNINIMNELGIIIASGDSNRIGTSHRAAERAIKEKKIIEVYQDTHLEKKGTNEPIIYEDTIIGVVGITGDPNEVRPFTKIVKTVSLLLIEELNIYKQKEENRVAKNNLLKQIIQSEGIYTESLKKEAHEKYDLELGQPYYGVFAERKEILRAIASKKELFEWSGGFIIFVENVDSLEPTTKEFIIVSSSEKNISQNLQEIKQTYAMLSFLNTKKEGVNKTDSCYLANLFSFSLPPNQELLNKIKEVAPEYVETLISFAQNNKSINDTSLELHIHRNTLNYRIQKIEESTGKNPRVWYELWELFYHFAYFSLNN